MPMTAPLLLTSGPPESPGWIGALIWSSPLTVSTSAPLWSLAVMVWLRALTLPVVTAGVVLRPSALPKATTACPTLTVDELPTVTVWNVPPPSIWTSATSSVRSYPTTWAL